MAVAKGQAAAIFPAASGDWFGEALVRCLGRTTNGTVRFTGYRNGAGGFFDFTGSGLAFTALTPLPDDSAYFLSISRDGCYIAGAASLSTNGSVLDGAALWNAAIPGNPQWLGSIAGESYLEPHGVASLTNEPMVIGVTGSLGFGVVWKPTQGWVGLPNPPQHGQTGLTGVSADGSVIVAFASATHPGFDPLVWKDGVWLTLDRGDFPADYAFPNGADAVSHDGTVVAGYAGGRPAFWCATNYPLRMVTMNGTNLPLSWAGGIATDGGWVAGGSGGRGWIASVADGKAQFVEDWIQTNFSLTITQTVTSVYDVLVDHGEMFLILETDSGGVFVSGIAPPQPLTPPVLEIAGKSANEIQLRWPTNRSGTVEYTLQLPTTSWTPLTNAVPVLNSNQFTLTLPVTNTTAFFRLRVNSP